MKLIVGPLLFNIYINDIFLLVDNAQLCNYADDITLYSIQENHKTKQRQLKQKFLIFTEMVLRQLHGSKSW